MPLRAGTCLGPYEIHSLIGAGGMGEVYRASDTRLGRDIAIKVLQPAFSADPDRRSRFEREVRTIGALSHPNIVAVHDVGTLDAMTFLVMELLDGETLRSRLSSSGALPLRKALDVATQLALGLAAAHARDIVHRDLKPENIFLTADGRVKILDFGLARAVVQASHESETRTTLRDDVATEPGTVMGTVGYMSPEQVRGRQTDSRSDIFALGAVVFEMLTGARAFSAESGIETMSAILTVDPLQGRESSPALPPAVAGIVRHCLEKLPDERFQSARDLAFQLQTLASASSASGLAIDAEPSTVRRVTTRRVVLLIATATFLAGVSLASTWWLLRPGPNAGDDLPKYGELQTRTEIVSTWISNAIAISAAGDRVVFVGRNQPNSTLFQRRLDQREAVAINEAVAGSNASPSFSPNGRFLAFFSQGRVKTVPVDGGKPADLCSGGTPFGLSWGPDDFIVFATQSSSVLWRVRALGGVPESMTRLDKGRGETGHILPSSFLPDGSHLIFTIWYGSGRHDIALLDFATRTHKVILTDSSYAVFARSGHLVYSRWDGLYARRFDTARLEATGPEVPIVRDAYVGPRTNVGQFAISATGTLVYRAGAPVLDELVAVDRNTHAERPLSAPPHRYAFPRVSPDGTKILASVDEGRFTYPFVWDLTLQRPGQIKVNGHVHAPIWTPDSRNLIYRSDSAGTGRWKLYEQTADGTRPPRELFDMSGELTYNVFEPTSWAAHTLVGFGLERRGTQPVSSVLAFDVGASKLTQVVAGEEGASLMNARVSLDGHALAYVSNRSGRNEVYVRPYPGPGDAVRASPEGGSRTLWGPGGKLYYSHDPDGAPPLLMEVDVQTTPTLRVSPARVLIPRFPYSMGDHLAYTNWDITPDGKTFIVVRSISRAPTIGDDLGTRHLNMIVNFFAELRHKVKP